MRSRKRGIRSGPGEVRYEQRGRGGGHAALGAAASNLGMMRKVIVTEWMTLDGVVQAPGAPDEDTSGGFKHGAWHLGYFDDISREWVADNLNEAGGFLLGRRTYEGFAAHWPNASEEEQIIARPLNTKPKYVVSTTLRE